MKPPKINYVRHKDLLWPFERQPQVELRTKFSRYLEQVDPWPAYAHNRYELETMINHVEEIFPLPEPFRPQWFVLPFDGEPRANGSANRRFDYYSKRADKLKKERDTVGIVPANMTEWGAFIILYGKRTPIHPAMTRFVAAHEYGHVVDYYIERMMGMEPDRELGDKEYAKLRNMKNDQSYGAHGWHKNIGEIIADDFRILLAEVEEEHWPHNVSRPVQGTELHEWWLDKKERFSKR